MLREQSWAEVEAEWRERFGEPPPIRGETRYLRQVLDLPLPAVPVLARLAGRKRA